MGIRGGVAAIGSSAAGDCHLAGGVSPTGARATTVIVGGLGAALIPDYVGTPEAAAQRRPSLATRNLAAAAGGGSGVGLAGAPGSRGRRYSEAQVAAMTAGLTQLTAEHPPRPSPSPTPTAASSSSHHHQQQQQAQADEPARLRAATVSGVSPHGSPSMAAASQQQQQQQQPPLPHSSPLPAVVSEQHATQHAMPPPSQAPPLAPGGSAAGSSSRRRSQSDAATYAAEVRAMAMGVGGIPTDEAVGGSVGSVGFGLLGTSPPIPLPAGRAAATGRATAPPMFLAGSPPVTALGSSPHAAGRLSPSAAAASTSALPPHHPMPSSSAASSSQAPLHFAAQPLSSSPSSALAAALASAAPPPLGRSPRWTDARARRLRRCRRRAVGLANGVARRIQQLQHAGGGQCLSSRLSTFQHAYLARRLSAGRRDVPRCALLRLRGQLANRRRPLPLCRRRLSARSLPRVRPPHGGRHRLCRRRQRPTAGGRLSDRLDRRRFRYDPGNRWRRVRRGRERGRGRGAGGSVTASVQSTPQRSPRPQQPAGSSQSGGASSPDGHYGGMAAAVGLAGGSAMAVGGGYGLPRERVGSLSSRDADLPFQMEEVEEVDMLDGSGRAARPRLSSNAEEDEAAVGSLMMEVQSAPVLNLFTAPGRQSPLARSVDDMTSQLDRLGNIFGASLQQQPQPPACGLGGAATLPPLACPAAVIPVVSTAAGNAAYGGMAATTASANAAAQQQQLQQHHHHHQQQHHHHHHLQQQQARQQAHGQAAMTPMGTSPPAAAMLAFASSSPVGSPPACCLPPRMLPSVSR